MPSPPSLPSLAEAAAAFDAVRKRLFGIAYRMLGSVAETEDVLQDAWLKWQACDRRAVADSSAYLVTVVVRLALNARGTARARRESYVGLWLPEPVDTSADPGAWLENAEQLEFSLLRLLEELSPTERAAYVLREAFDYDYRKIGEVLATSEVNARKLVSRAHARVGAPSTRAVPAEEQRRLLTAFLTAARSGDVSELEQLLAADVVSVSDGGPGVRAVRAPVEGRARTARFVARVAERFWSGARVQEVNVNGQPAALLSRDGRRLALVVLDVWQAQIRTIFWVLNPDKLRHVTTSRPALSEV